MNARSLSDPNAIAGMSKLWDGLKAHVPFMFKFCKVVKYYKLFCIRKAKEAKQRGTNLRSRLEVIQEELQMKPQDDASRVVMEHVIEALREFEKTN
jgi:hypothetical protein